MSDITFADRVGRERSSNVPKGAVIAGLLIIGLLLFFIFCFRTVGAGQVGIITRFGEVNRVADSGPTIKLPWPIEHVTKMEIRVQKEELAATAATSDLQDANATLALNYSIDNATALNIFKTLGVDYKDRVVTPAVQESFKSAAAQYTASQLVTERNAVKGKAYDSIKQRLDKYGIRVVDLNIVNFAFSAEFSKAIEQVQVANQQVSQARQELEKTKVDAEKAITAAQGQAEAQRLQQQSLTPEILQNNAINKWNGVMPQSVGGESILGINLQGTR